MSWRSPFSSRHSPPLPEGPSPSKPTTAKNILKNTLVLLEKATDGVPVPGLKAAAGSLLEVIKIIDKTKQNQDGLRDLGTHLQQLQDAIITPILEHQHMGISLELQARIDRLSSDLSKHAHAVLPLKSAHRFTQRFINYEEYGIAIGDMNRKIKESLDAFSLDNDIANAIAIDNIQHSVVRMEKHSLSKDIQALPRANAAYNDYSRSSAPGCFEGTREGVLQDVKNWFFSGSTLIYVLLGIAGVGKSTIAQTIAALIASEHHLAASFFFSRYESGRSTSQTFFPTLAFQLAQHSQYFATRISKALQKTPDAAQKSLSLQLQMLIIDPLKDVPNTVPPMLVVIDALDECEEAGAAEILHLVLTQLVKLPFIKVFLTTRPETHLKPAIDQAQTRNGLVLHDIEASVVAEDIRRFLENGLSPGEVEKVVGYQWICEAKDMDALVLAAGKLFIVASTCEKFIKDKTVANPQRQLSTLLESFETRSSSGSSAFSVLDALYLQILETAMPTTKPKELEFVTDRFQHVVGSIITLQNPLSSKSLANLLSRDVRDVDAVLRHLQSIIVSSQQDPFPRVYHPSFPDFISDATRCEDQRFLIETPKHHTRLAGLCLDLMNRTLKRNICKLEIADEYLENKDMPDLSAKIAGHIPPELQYGCLYWGVHLNKSMAHGTGLVEKLEKFAFNHLLAWLEVLSLIGRMDVAYQTVTDARKFATDYEGPQELQTIFNDAHRLIIGSHDIIKMSALHVYYSALPFIPEETVLWRKYEKEARDSVRVVMGRDRNWDPLLAVLSGHTNRVNSIALSPNGSRLASASSDLTVRVWDVSGASVAVMNGHSDSVTSVVFSPDSTRLASASFDNTVRVWDVASGAEVAVMNGHSYWVRSVVFSPNGTRLASASFDNTVRVWDAASGTEVAVMDGHSDWVFSVVFSHDGAHLASASKDKTVRVWDAVSGASVAVMNGHLDSVGSVAFSPDDTHLASASSDKTVRVWDVVSETLVAIMNGHSHSVRSVVFSPNGTHLASASKDNTVRVWNVMSGAEVAIMNGHSHSVISVAFSPDGTRLASASKDNTVRVWNAVSGAEVAVMNGHSYWVRSVVFSPDGTRLTSASSDNTVRVWDAVSGGSVAVMNGRSDSVGSVVFSPDGTHLASASSDKTVQVWNAASGAEVAIMNGHSGWVTSVVFSPDGTHLASASEDKTVQVWNAMSGASVAIMNGHSDWVTSVVFSPDGTRLASASDDNTARVWDAVSGASVAVMNGHSDSVWSVAFSSDGTRLASASEDNTARVWDAVTGASIAVMNGHSHLVFLVVFSPNGTCLASASSDNTLRVWNAVTGTEVAVMNGHLDWVRSVVFSPDGTRLASASDDKTVRVWDIATGALLAVSPLNGNHVEPPSYPDAAWYQGMLIFAADPSSYISQPNHPAHLLLDSSVGTQQNIQESSSNLLHTTPTPNHQYYPKRLLLSHHDRTQSNVIYGRTTEHPTNIALCWLPSRFRQVYHIWDRSSLALLQGGHLTLLDTSSLQLE